MRLPAPTAAAASPLGAGGLGSTVPGPVIIADACWPAPTSALVVPIFSPYFSAPAQAPPDHGSSPLWRHCGRGPPVLEMPGDIRRRGLSGQLDVGGEGQLVVDGRGHGGGGDSAGIYFPTLPDPVQEGSW